MADFIFTENVLVPRRRERKGERVRREGREGKGCNCKRGGRAETKEREEGGRGGSREREMISLKCHN